MKTLKYFFYNIQEPHFSSFSPFRFATPSITALDLLLFLLLLILVLVAMLQFLFLPLLLSLFVFMLLLLLLILVLLLPLLLFLLLLLLLPFFSDVADVPVTTSISTSTFDTASLFSYFSLCFSHAPASFFSPITAPVLILISTPTASHVPPSYFAFSFHFFTQLISSQTSNKIPKRWTVFWYKLRSKFCFIEENLKYW